MAKAPSIARILDAAGQTYCEQAGFTLADKPAPLFQLLTLSMLLAKPIAADMGVAACTELRRAGARTASGMGKLTWQQRVDALGLAHYRRYDESMATLLGKSADDVQERYSGDLRRLAEAAEHDPARAGTLLGELPGIGPAGADIFLREAQRVWSWLVPFIDNRVLDGARRLGLPHGRTGLARRFEGVDAAALAAALVRVGLDDDLAATLTS